MKEIKEYTFHDFINEIDIDNIDTNLLAFNFLEGIYIKQFKARKKEVDNENKKILYKYLINQLQQIKSALEKKEELTYTFTKPVYSDEDIEFLKQSIENKDLSLFDLTWDEAMLLGISGEQYRRLQRTIYCQINLSQKKQKEFDKITKNINEYNVTPRLVYNIYISVKTKK